MLLQWCLEKKIAKTRLGATALGKLMQRMGLLDHVTEDHAFKDMNLLYQFKVVWSALRHASQKSFSVAHILRRRTVMPNTFAFAA